MKILKGVSFVTQINVRSKMLRIGVFADVSNLYFCCKEKFQKKINYLKLLQFATGENSCIAAVTYGIRSTDSGNFIKALENIGWKVNFRVPKGFLDGSKKADCDTHMILDVVRYTELLDSVVLCTADGDFAPLIEWLHEKRRKVIVIGCNISHELTEIADTSLEITEKILE